MADRRLRSSRPIPRTQLGQGILTAICVSSLRLAEADSLLAAGYLTGAGIVFSFAVEEFGRAVMLREALHSGADPAVIEGFYDHAVKLEAASKLIGTEHLRLSAGAFQKDFVQDGVFQVGTSADKKTRFDGLYVEWDGEWQYGATVDPGVLKESIDGVQEIVSHASAFWPEATTLKQSP